MIYIGAGILHLADNLSVESGGEIPQIWADANKDAVQSLTDRGLTDGKPSEKKEDSQSDDKAVNAEIKRLNHELKEALKKDNGKSEKIIADLKSEIDRLVLIETENQESIEMLSEENSGLNIYIETLKKQIIDFGEKPIEPEIKPEKSGKDK